MDNDLARGIERLKQIMEADRILRLSEPQPLQGRMAFYFVVRAFEKEWDFAISWEALQDLPAMPTYISGATDLARGLGKRFRNPSPSLFYCPTGKVVSIDVEWPMEALANRAASYLRAKVRDSIDGGFAYCYVVITHQQSIFELKENPFALHRALANSIRAGVDRNQIRFYPSDDHPVELQELKLSLSSQAVDHALDVDQFIRGKVFWMAFRAGRGRERVWVTDQWDADYLGVPSGHLSQSAHILAAQNHIELDDSGEFASIGQNLLARARTFETSFRPKVTVPSGQAWDVFISHAKEDADTFVRPLAQILQERGITVWFDEYQLKLGDSLRESIDQGLSKSRFGVVVLSPSFFAKQWTQKELNALVSREVEGKKLILPVWHNITASELRNVSPMLADRFAVSSSEGIARVADAIVEATGRVKGGGS